jgi:hypothetical protein
MKRVFSEIDIFKNILDMFTFPRGSKYSSPGSSRNKPFSRVVQLVYTLETSIEHFVSLKYSVGRSPRYMWIKQLKLRIPIGVLIYHFK